MKVCIEWKDETINGLVTRLAFEGTGGWLVGRQGGWLDSRWQGMVAKGII